MIEFHTCGLLSLPREGRCERGRTGRLLIPTRCCSTEGGDTSCLETFLEIFFDQVGVNQLWLFILCAAESAENTSHHYLKCPNWWINIKSMSRKGPFLHGCPYLLRALCDSPGIIQVRFSQGSSLRLSLAYLGFVPLATAPQKFCN